MNSLILADTKGKDINHHQQARKGFIVLFQDAQALRGVRAGHLGLVRNAIICTLLPISLTKYSCLEKYLSFSWKKNSKAFVLARSGGVDC